VRLSAERPAIAYAGSVKRHKGGELLPDLVRETGAGVAWHVFGGGDEDLLRALRGLPNVKVHGYYRRGRLPALLARHRVGLVVLPTIVPESYSLVLSEAWRAGAAVLAFDLGAPAERIRLQGGGFLAPLESRAAGLAEIAAKWASGSLTTTVPRVVPTPHDAARATISLYRTWGVL
jgi:glycosyltransferase involved in cell wall biosynthesis